MSDIEVARENLRAIIGPIRDEREKHSQCISELDLKLEPLEAALSALDGPQKAKSKTGRKAGKPSAKKSDVMTVCQTIVQDNQPIPKADLQSLVKHKLGEELGFDLKGFSLRFSEVMKYGCIHGAREWHGVSGWC